MSLSESSNINLTNFIKGGIKGKNKVRIISDFEGKIPFDLYTKISRSIADERFIYCGDIADYTTMTTIEIDDPDRYKFIKFITFINNNPSKFAYVFGNRDLCKIKVLQLVVFKDQENKWWRGTKPKDVLNGQNYSLNNEDILEISKLLLKENKPDWLFEDLTFFYPFSGNPNPSINEWKGWISAERKLTLYERYLAIFGTSPKDGFMSAANTIIGIALELGLLRNEIEVYMQEINLPVETTKSENFFNAANKLAALVFTVYARILDPELSKKKKWNFDGSLYEYFTNGNIVLYAFDNNDKKDSTKLYLFSHGGVHSNFKKDLMSTIGENTLFWKAVDEKMKDIILSKKKTKALNISQTPQTGGQIDSVDDLDYFNKMVKTYINLSFDEFIKGYEDNTKVSHNLQLVSSLAGFSGTFSEDDLKKEVFQGKDIKYWSIENSTVLSGYYEIMKDEGKIFRTENSLEIYNIMGHRPIGHGYGFSISPNGSKIICTDFSNSFSSLPLTDFNRNTFTLFLQNNTFSLEGQIFFDIFLIIIF